MKTGGDRMPSVKRMTNGPKEIEELERVLSRIENGSTGSMQTFKQLEQFYEANIAFNQKALSERQRQRSRVIRMIPVEMP